MEVTGLFDTHCHLDDEKFDADRDQVLSRCLEHGITHCLVAGSDVASSQACVDLATQHSWIYAAVGVHPHVAQNVQPEYLTELRALAQDARVVAIGETGLDYYYDNSPREVQKERLIEQLELATELGKPVILHVREAHGDMQQLLSQRGTDHPGGIIHCFTGSLESAQHYISLGYYISFAGALTYKNADRLRRVAGRLPLERLLIETDSPYLSPVPLRGRRNEPHHVRFVCAALAQAHGLDTQEVADITRRNALKLFGLPADA